MDLITFKGLVEQWSIDKELHLKDARIQTLKALEELGEVASGMLKGKLDKVMDGIGDVIVVLIIMCQQLNIKLEDCLDIVWKAIAPRKGKTIDGVFVKEEDLLEENKGE